MDGARAFAQKMNPGFYVRKVDEGYKTMWVMRDWAPGGKKGPVNGYVKKTHPDMYSAMVWLVQRGCEVKKESVPPEAYEEALAIRREYEAVAESERKNALAVFTASGAGPEGSPASDTDTRTPFALLEEGLAEEQPEAYERVDEPPAPEEAPLPDSAAPSGAPETTSPTSPTILSG